MVNAWQILAAQAHVVQAQFVRVTVVVIPSVDVRLDWSPNLTPSPVAVLNASEIQTAKAIMFVMIRDVLKNRILAILLLVVQELGVVLAGLETPFAG